MGTKTEKIIGRPRRVVVFKNDEYERIEQYAAAKMLDVVAFMKFATQTYMDKYPRKAKSPQE
jgi:hypothetical protein